MTIESCGNGDYNVNQKEGRRERMNTIMKEYMEKISFGDMQVHDHVAVIPLMMTNGIGPEYFTLKEALASDLLTISELTEGGHVPELKVQNRAEKPVLIIDGEELSGAKQNRVLNTTILLKEQSETVIPVSCTEQGRWSYRSAHFEESGHIMSAKLRRVKNESVMNSLKFCRGYQSDQSAVWEEIQAQSEKAKVSSPTHAMKDIHEARENDLDAYLEHFTIIPDQKGLIVIVNGQVAGLDMVSQADAFKVLYPKLIKSYIMDAILEKPAKGKTPGPDKAKAFLDEMIAAGEQTYDSVGYGRDFRYEGKKLVGSALVHEDAVIHMAFFRTTQAEKGGFMAGTSRRRNFRQ